MTNSPMDLSQLAREEYCYLTTHGRKTGRLHEIEIWFCVNRNSIYMLSGGMDGSDWVKNLMKDPHVTIRIAEQAFPALARIVADKEEEMQARNLLADKYGERESDGSLSEWARTALAVGFDVSPQQFSPSSFT